MIDPVETFKTEAREHLVNLEGALLELEEVQEDRELIDTAFRSMHTIKGAAGMFGYQDLTDFTHHLETALDKVRNGEMEISKELIGILLDAKDTIEESLATPAFDTHLKIVTTRIISRLYELIPEGVASQKSGEQLPEKTQINGSDVYRVRIKPSSTTYQLGLDIIPILRELNSLGTCHVTTCVDELEGTDDYDPQLSYLYWDIILQSKQPAPSIADVFMFVEDDWQIAVDPIDLTDGDEQSDKLGELLVSRRIINRSQLDAILSQKAVIGSQMAQQGLATESAINAALTEQRVVRSLKQSSSGQDATIRVPSSRLDTLMNLVGELVIVQARLNQFAFNNDSEELLSIAEELDVLTTQMRDQTFSIRMVPIGSTFGKFKRLVRDLSNELDKRIQLETYGAETELDKMVIDKLSDPLIHLIRNSIDHGIESQTERTASGKSETGTIVLSAEHSDSFVVIRIKDDGAGLNSTKIKQRAVEKQLIDPQEVLDDEAVHHLIFEPGFSTSETVSDISGRGVGMDVVRRSIQELGGTISIATQPNKGTEFTIRLPMTLAIIEGLMVKVGGESYVLPLSAVEECIELSHPNVGSHTRKRIVEVRGEQIPFLYLREWFDIRGEPPSIEQIVITHVGQEQFGFCVDEVVGQYQTVIKRLGKLYEGATGFSGATILGDGSVAMILDPSALMDAVGENQRRTKRSLTISH
ncbi:chemotaxis protein CheA [Aestuariibacter sp. GS-14]|uniref:chemotaxis protein CheA n=1 Tax=Aestuariibacter sp. GS-14 TaxID=2590670 RepID=UPI00112A8EF1|nr:chemotaxis protein CheA [Aestuariibacter sp. GS-14]TPV57342.1 chemotaxis protein CheA [Aestuariibacter sp. GS-14]